MRILWGISISCIHHAEGLATLLASQTALQCTLNPRLSRSWLGYRFGQQGNSRLVAMQVVPISLMQDCTRALVQYLAMPKLFLEEL